MSGQKDNSTFERKKFLRLLTLQKIKNPVVMETHGGIGKLFASCYSTLHGGVVFERDPLKVQFLARQRPTWAVYQCDVIKALQAGAGAHVEVNFLDIDPYGESWKTLEAFFSSSRPFAQRMAVVYNDGMRHALKIQGSWPFHSLQRIAFKYGSASVYKRYKDICRELLADCVIRQGYTIESWTSYYCGEKSAMTHWAAILSKVNQGQAETIPTEEKSNGSDTGQDLRARTPDEGQQPDIPRARRSSRSRVPRVREQTGEGSEGQAQETETEVKEQADSERKDDAEAPENNLVD